jgi:hypothetical protein
MVSSICNMLDVTWKFGLACTMVWMVSCSLAWSLPLLLLLWGRALFPFQACALLSSALGPALCCQLILNLTSLVLGIFELLNCVFLYFFCHEVGVILSNRVLWKLLVHLGLLCDPPVCMIGRLGGPVSCGVVVEGVSCVVVSPIPCSPCVGAVSFFPCLCIFLWRTPLLLLRRLLTWLQFLGATLSPAGVLDPLLLPPFLWALP